MEKNMNAFILSSFCHGFKSKIKHSHTLLNNGDTFWEVSLGDSDPVQTRWGHEEQNKTRLNQAQRKRCNREMRFVATHEAWGERDGPMRSEQADEATWITAGRNEGEPFYLHWTGLGLTWTAQLCISATGNLETLQTTLRRTQERMLTCPDHHLENHHLGPIQKLRMQDWFSSRMCFSP